MRKILFGFAAVIAVLATLGMTSGSANAAKPDGTIVYKDPAFAPNENASLLGLYGSRIIQNGQFVSGTSGSTEVPDQTTYPGSRADLVQGYLGH